MILGIGVDTTDIQRIERSIARPYFLQRVFGPEEQKLLDSKQGSHLQQTAAGCFAAKESFLKACGEGLGGFSLPDIQALRKESGQPYFWFSGPALAYVAEKNLAAHLSITHEGRLATAFVILESNNPE